MSDMYDDLEKLADLKNKGIITNEEFQAKKREILESPIVNSGNEEIKPINPSATDSIKKEFDSIKWEKRILCSNESCIGTIGPDGKCRECGKPYEKDKPIKKDKQIKTPATDSLKEELDSIKKGKPHQNFQGDWDKYGKWIKILIPIILIIGVLGYCSDNRNESQKVTPAEAPKVVPPEAPSAESQFVDTLDNYYSSYKQAPNQIQKSDIFNNARNFESQYFQNMGNHIDNWKAKMSDINTNKGGSSLTLEVSIKMKTGNGIYFKQGSIDPSSPIYQVARNIEEGACVIFSGDVESKEDSISESGAMIAPEYKINFTNLSRCVN